MDGRAAQSELARAERALAVAFEQARAVGYRAGSSQMQDLQDAELEYQRVRSRRDLPPDPAAPPDPAQPPDPAEPPDPVGAVEVAEGLVVLPGVDRELDLRGPEEPEAAARVPRRGEHRPR